MRLKRDFFCFKRNRINDFKVCKMFRGNKNCIFSKWYIFHIMLSNYIFMKLSVFKENPLNGKKNANLTKSLYRTRKVPGSIHETADYTHNAHS